MKKMGLAMTPENRKEEGLVQVLSIRENLSLASLQIDGALQVFSTRGWKPLTSRSR